MLAQREFKGARNRTLGLKSRSTLLQVVIRIIADLDNLAGFSPVAEEDVKKGGVEAMRARHRRRLVERDPPPMPSEERAAAPRALLKLLSPE